MQQSEYLKDKAMPVRSRHKGHDKYKNRIMYLFKAYREDEYSSTETQANSAKYLAVLVSGYLEQAIKELLVDYASKGSRQQISRYIEETWPISKNMNDENIRVILQQFNPVWGQNFSIWLEQDSVRKGHINSIVSWRNRIAHGDESNTTGVTLVSVGAAFVTIRHLVSFIDNMVGE
jgi:hypothetical protein